MLIFDAITPVTPDKCFVYLHSSAFDIVMFPDECSRSRDRYTQSEICTETPSVREAAVNVLAILKGIAEGSLREGKVVRSIHVTDTTS